MLATLVVTATVATGGCGKRAPATEAPSADAGAVGGEEASAEGDWAEALTEDPLAEAEAELRDYEDSLLQAGVELPDPVAKDREGAGLTATPAASDASADRCTRICTLADAVCGLRDRICDLADEHEDDTRYAKACERAGLDCTRASEACEGCDA